MELGREREERKELLLPRWRAGVFGAMLPAAGNEQPHYREHSGFLDEWSDMVY